MPDFATFQLCCAVLMLGVAALSVWRGRRDSLGLAWAAFCISAAASLSLRALGSDGSPAVFVLLAPAAATCGVAWLLARALFREERAITAVHLGVVLVIALVNLSPSGAFGAMLGNLQNLLASTVIVLTLWEAVRGWAAAPARGERLMRGAYVGVTGLAVLVAVVWLGGPDVAPGLNDAVETTALLAVSLTAGLCLLYRRRHPLAPAHGAAAGTPSQPARPVDPETRQLAARLDAMVQAEALYLNGDLKVADLARKLQVPDYKITRAITGALGAANFNQYINRFRIKFAQDLITEDPARSILIVAFDSGFASLGPFNRAFKMMTGQTPRAWRAGLGMA